MFRIHLFVLLAGVMAFGQGTTPRKLIGSLEGKDLYVAYCASCHGIGGHGNGPAAAAMKGPMADLTTIAKRNNGFPREELEKMILGGKGSRAAHGSEEMPVWGPVFRKVENDRDMGLVRVRRLILYVESIQKK